MNIKKPPDKDKRIVVKCPLKTIIKDKNNIAKIIDVCFRTNKLIIHTYQFLRLWILTKYSLNNEIPKITKETIIQLLKGEIEYKDPREKDNWSENNSHTINN